MHDEGINASDIAEVMGCRRQKICKILKSYGLKPNNKKPLRLGLEDEEEIEKAWELYESGETLQSVVKKMQLNFSPSNLRGLFVRRGKKLRSRGRQPNFNDTYFQNIDNEHKAYWLGFIYADGTLVGNNLRILIKESDAGHLRKFCEDINSKNKISFTNKGDGHECCYTSVESKNMGLDLRKLGLVENKTFKLDCFPDIPYNLTRHFIRGFFDGNGTVYVNSRSGRLRFGFYSTKPFLEKIQQYLHEQIDTPVNGIYEKVGCWLLSYSRIEDVDSIYKLFYSDATIYLERKKDIFDKYI